MTRRQRRNAARQRKIHEARAQGFAIIPRHRAGRAKMWEIIRESLEPEQLDSVLSSPEYYLPLIYPTVIKILHTKTEINRLQDTLQLKTLDDAEKLDDVIECDASSISESE
ncbi:unnamed protein product [Trichogramma brassicae]|uniref:Uncharacterized protein n=1 Tax=Trichogramma brassicae TaxID=86971 RepID=A0A6H5IBW6_9HYME|nr:unnamed protein product [Trichogramma brassicae]